VRRLALARLASVGGSQAAQIALAYTIYRRTHSSAWVALSLVASAGIVGLLGPVSGWISDRFDRRRVMVAAEAAGAVGWLGLLVVRSPGALVATALVATAANAPFRSASAAAIPNLVADEDLTWANGSVAIAFNASLVVGPLVGGVLVAAGGARTVFAVNAATFAVSAVVIARIPGRFSSATTTGPGTGMDLGRGWRLVRRDDRLRPLVAATTLTFAAFGLTLVADPPLAAHFHAGSVGYALLTTLWGAGAVLGSWLAARGLRPQREPAVLVWGTAAMGLAIGAIAAMPTFALAVAVGTVGGVGSGLGLAAWFSLVQRATPDQGRGAVFALAETCEQGAFVAGMLAAGGIIALVDVPLAYLAPGSVLLAAAAVAHRARVGAPDPSPPLLGAPVPPDP
jgi:MFS family permease